MNRPDPKKIDAWLGLVISVILLDMMTGRRLARTLSSYKDWAQRSWQPRPADLPAPVVSALHEEARKITRDAAGGPQ